MRIIIRAALRFKRQKPAAKPSFGTKVITALITSAATFPDLPVKIQDLQQANDALAAAISQALTGNRESIAARNNANAVWNDLFTRIANYVTTVAEGDAQTITMAGFDPTKGESSRAQKPGAIKDFFASTNGFKNAVIAGTGKGVPGAKAFGFVAAPAGAEITTDGNMTIITIDKYSIYFLACTQKQAELYNLPEGEPYTITMFAVNSAGTGPAVTSQPVRPQ